jgi:hypothetical protein
MTVLTLFLPVAIVGLIGIVVGFIFAKREHDAAARRSEPRATDTNSGYPAQFVHHAR